MERKIVHVDMDGRTYELYDADEDMIHKWIGGRALAHHLLKGKDDRIVIARGPLSKMPGLPGQACAYFVSPKTGGLFYSNSGGNAHEISPLAIIIDGQSDERTVLRISAESVEFVPADDIWTKDRYETMEALEGRYGKDRTVFAIGNAESVDENVMNNSHGFFGRGGLGYVLRQKGIKAMVVDRLGRTSAPATKEYMTLLPSIVKKINSTPAVLELRKGGTVGFLLKELGSRKWLPIEIDAEDYLKQWDSFDKTPHPCNGCPIACKKNYEFWGGVVSGYFQGARTFKDMEKIYKERTRKGLDAVTNDRMLCMKEDKFVLALATSNRLDLNQLVLTKMVREGMEPEDIVQYVIDVQNEIVVADSAAICAFSLYALNLEDIARLLTAVGIEKTAEDLYKMGDDIYRAEMEENMQRGVKYRTFIADDGEIGEYMKRRGITGT